MNPVVLQFLDKGEKMDWNNLWGQVKEQAGNAWDNAVATGLPVIKLEAEKQLLNLVNKQHEATKEEVKGVLAQVSSGPESATGALFKETIFDKYKYHLIAGVAVLIGVGYYARFK